jgi:hypothetical protein
MSNENDIYKYLGLAVVVLFVIYVIVKTLTFQANIVEGLTNQTPTNDFTLLENSANTSSQNIKKQNDRLNDIISISKYRTDYENLLISLEEYTNIMMLSKVIDVGNIASAIGVGKNITPEIITDMVTANTLKAFVDTLNASMKYIDRKK